MNVKVEIQKEEAWRRVLAIEVPAEDAEREYDEVARRVAKKVRLPGFRKGKVPVSLIRKSFKEDVDQEFLETVVPKALGRALDETGLDPVTSPKFEDVSFGESRALSFTADFECRPSIEAATYRGITGVKEVQEVANEEVEKVLEDFRKSRATLEEVSRPSIEGDVLLLDYHAVDENDRPIPKRSVKGYVLELGAGRVVADFETAVRGAEPGALREAHVPYPEDYSDKFLAGRTVRYKIKVLKVSEKRFPVLTDELVAATTNFKTIEELRMKIRADLEEQAERVGVDRLERSLLEKVVDANSFEPPASLVEGLLEDVVAQLKFEAESRGQDPSSIDPEAIRSANRSGAAREIRRSLVLDGIARAEHIRVSSQEIESAVALMAKRRGLPAKKLLSQMGGDRFIRRLSRQLRDKKTLAFLARNAEISQKIVSGNREEAAEKASP